MNPLIVIAGPTAVGKSSLAVKLAHKINGSIISCDSMQVYRGMDIGTAKISEDETEGIRHYLIDILDPSEDFNIVMFQEMAKNAIEDIRRQNRIPILVGGTGFYIQSIVYDIDFTEHGEDEEYRDMLWDLIAEKGGKYVHKMLEQTDPEAAGHIHYNDSKRMIRALEYNRQTGGLISDHNAKSLEKTSPYDLCYFVLNDDRQKIYERIDKRVDQMMEEGLLDEVKSLKGRGLSRDNVSMLGLGYKEILDHLDGLITLDEAVYRIKRDSRHFAKRQLTWFKREKDVIWLNLNEDKDIYEKISGELIKKGIINERFSIDV